MHLKRKGGNRHGNRNDIESKMKLSETLKHETLRNELLVQSEMHLKGVTWKQE